MFNNSSTPPTPESCAVYENVKKKHRKHCCVSVTVKIKQTRHSVTLHVHCSSCPPPLAFLASHTTATVSVINYITFHKQALIWLWSNVTLIFRRKTLDGLRFTTQLTATTWFGRLTGWSYSGQWWGRDKDLGNLRRFPLQMFGSSTDEGLPCSVYDYSADQGIFSDTGTRLCTHTHIHTIKPARTRIENICDFVTRNCQGQSHSGQRFNEDYLHFKTISGS